MTELIALLSTGKGTWSNVIKLINREEWSKVIILTNEFGEQKFKPNDKAELIKIDMNLKTERLRDQILNKLKDKVIGPEVALNLTSGSGKEHMAIISAILKLGLGIRFVEIKDNEIVEL